MLAVLRRALQRIIFGRPQVLEGHMSAVLQTLAHHTDIAATNAGAVSASRQVIASGVRVLLGFGICETAGATAKVRLRDGTSASAPVLMPLTFAANGSAGEFFPDEGVEVTSGAIYLEVVSGSVEGIVYWG